ncbi:MAG: phosphate acetyltransferase [Marinilabiliales bacterium]|nr:phosphate acetyltransferase [Marinilabiliales bacterium]
MDLLNKIKENAVRLQNHIVLPEGSEIRTLKATDQILKDKIARVTLLGNKEVIESIAAREGLSIAGAAIVDPATDVNRSKYAEMMVELRKSKGLTLEQALQLLNDPLYFGVMMIKAGDADGEVAGAINATGDVLRPAFQFVKTLPGVSVVSGLFFMIFQDKSIGDKGMLVFADCAVMPDPNSAQLAEIAVTTAASAKAIANIEPRVAMLSFSTKGSAQHDLVTKVADATRMAAAMNPDLLIDGEMQLDAALVPEVGQLKSPGSKVAGRANVLVFPGLEAGNIGYKLVQRLAGAEAIGPVLQGMAAPINDLSRGCSVSDIVNMVAITANQAGEK